MIAETGVPSTFIEVYLKDHNDPDPNHSEQLCDEASTQKLGKYVECLKKIRGDDMDFVRLPLDVGAVYEVGGGLLHGSTCLMVIPGLSLVCCNSLSSTQCHSSYLKVS